MRRRIFTILSALSLLLCLATAAVGIRSYWIGECVGCETRDFTRDALARRIYGVSLSRGGLACSYALEYFPNVTPGRLVEWKQIYPIRTARFRYRDLPKYPHSATFVATLPNYLGFSYHYWRQDDRQRLLGWRALIVPVWLPAMLLGLLPARWLMLRRGRWQREHRAALGLCLACGYDLRASEGKCPECGTPIPAGLRRQPLT